MEGPEYLINKAKSAQNPYEAKAWIITAKTLFPNDFSIQFETFLQEKSEGNHEAAAKCFSYLVLTFQNQSVHLWNEIQKLTSALRGQTGDDDQEFYLKMFQHIPYEVQHKILLLTANNPENPLDHCRLILMLMKRYPQAIPQHAPCLLDQLIKGVSSSSSAGNGQQYREMLITEALPLVLQKPLDIPISSRLLNMAVATTIEHYVGEIYRQHEDDKYVLECWRKAFETLELCGQWLKWDKFLRFNRSYGKDVYWQKLMQIIAATTAAPATNRSKPVENKQIFYTSLLLFLYSLQDYMGNVSRKDSGRRLDYLLVESVSSQGLPKSGAFGSDSVQIIVTEPCRQETPNCLITAAHLWQLFQSNELLQMESNQFLLRLPIGDWVTRFISDLAVYLGRPDDLQSILTTARDGLEKDLSLLSLAVLQNNLSGPAISPLILNILKELAQTTEIEKGEFLKDAALPPGRSLFLLPLTKRAILQYCVSVLLSKLNTRLSMTEPSDTLMGYVLVLLQLNWPNGSSAAMANQIFNLISSRRAFTFLPFSKYIILMDFIEEFSFLWSVQGGEVNLEFSSSSKTRNYGTRNRDRGVKEDFKQVLRDQIARTHEDMESLIMHFILEEQDRLFEMI